MPKTPSQLGGAYGRAMAFMLCLLVTLGWSNDSSAIEEINILAKKLPADPQTKLSLEPNRTGAFGWGVGSSGLPPTSPDPASGGRQTPPSPSKKGTAGCSEDDAGGDGEGTSEGNPVKLSTGEKWQDEVDFLGASQYGLGLTRTYRSTSSTGSMFGQYWQSSLNVPRLNFTFSACNQTPAGDCIPSNVIWTAPSGAQHIFTWIGWTDDGHYYTYTANGNSALGDLTYTYGSKWELFTNTTRYTYTNGGYISKVADMAGAATTYT